MKWVITFALVLLASVALQFRGQNAGVVDHSRPNLRKLLSARAEGWHSIDIPLGETEMLQSAVANTLRYDDYIYRKYNRGLIEFTIYVAYWAPGKHPPQMIAQHTPDICWTMAGMKCDSREHDVRKKAGRHGLWPAQARRFITQDGKYLYTMFWHKIGDRSFPYRDRLYTSPVIADYWLESLRFALLAKQPQLFIRITSNVSLEEIWNESAFQDAISGFADLGITNPSN